MDTVVLCRVLHYGSLLQSCVPMDVCVGQRVIFSDDFSFV